MSESTTPSSGHSSAPAAPADGTFSEPYVHTQLHGLPQYVASSAFLQYVEWRKNGKHDILAVRGEKGSDIVPVDLTVVCKISANQVYLSSSGTFFLNRKYPEDDVATLNSAKQAATGVRPSGYQDFEKDYDVACRTLVELQKKVAKSAKHLHFLSDGSMRFNFPLWETKGRYNTDDDERDRITDCWKVLGSEEQAMFDEKKKRNHIRLMTVYDSKGNINTDVDSWESLLVGAIVEIEFNLLHFYIANNKDGANDTFTARIQQISVLVDPPPPSKMQVSPRKPRRAPQTPSRSEMVNAAKSFLPFPPGVKRPYTSSQDSPSPSKGKGRDVTYDDANAEMSHQGSPSPFLGKETDATSVEDDNENEETGNATKKRRIE